MNVNIVKMSIFNVMSNHSLLAGDDDPVLLLAPAGEVQCHHQRPGAHQHLASGVVHFSLHKLILVLSVVLLLLGQFLAFYLQQPRHQGEEEA